MELLLILYNFCNFYYYCTPFVMLCWGFQCHTAFQKSKFFATDNLTFFPTRKAVPGIVKPLVKPWSLLRIYVLTPWTSMYLHTATLNHKRQGNENYRKVSELPQNSQVLLWAENTKLSEKMNFQRITEKAEPEDTVMDCQVQLLEIPRVPELEKEKILSCQTYTEKSQKQWKNRNYCLKRKRGFRR